MGLYDGRVLIVHSNPSIQQIIVDQGNFSGSNLSAFAKPFRLNQYFFQACEMFSMRLLRTKGKLIPLRFAWRGA